MNSLWSASYRNRSRSCRLASRNSRRRYDNDQERKDSLKSTKYSHHRLLAIIVIEFCFASFRSKLNAVAAPRPRSSAAILLANSKNSASAWRRPVVPLLPRSSSTRNARPSSANSAGTSRRLTSSTSLPSPACVRNTTMPLPRWASRSTPSTSSKLGEAALSFSAGENDQISGISLWDWIQLIGRIDCRRISINVKPG